MRRTLLFLLLIALVSTGLHADGATFDLLGPKVDVRVKRGTVTLPIAQVPNLQPGDRLWIHPDLPPSQSERFVLVIAFLRGVTNPPPNDWFTRVETWLPNVRSEGVFVTVPKEAQQTLMFLAPETGGDFNTLRKAVHDQPGSFIRAAQDMQGASWDRMRVEAYLAHIKVSSQIDQKTLKERAEMATRSLGLKLDQGCFDKPADQQAACLAQNPEGMVFDDSSTQSRVEQMASGSTIDLMNNISASSMGGSGVYSAYVGAVVDMAKIFSSMHTAHFQYIPALALPAGDTFNLRLNTPPSFRNPKSVVVVALPPVGPAKPQSLRPVNPAESFCAQKPDLVLPAEGAPLFFATEAARELKLHIDPPAHSKSDPLDLPLTVDLEKGGLVLTHPAPSLPEGELSGEVRGKWGFDDWAGPRYKLYFSGDGVWTVAAVDQSALVVGREDTLHLEGHGELCIDRIEKQTGTDAPSKLTWKVAHPGQLELTLPMKDAAPGTVTLSIYQFGQPKPEKLEVKAYADAASIERLILSTGDTEAVLKGTRLDEVAKAELDGIVFLSGELSRAGDADQLTMKAGTVTSKLVVGKKYTAKVELADGRTLKVPATVLPARPQVALLRKGVQDARAAATVQFGSSDDLPLGGRLVFFLKSIVPANFPRDQKVEVAGADGGFRTELSLADGTLMLGDAHTAMGSIEPLRRFGASAFGPVRVRAVSAHGVAGEWIPLGTLVRLPALKELRCPHVAAKPCTLVGSNLFLASAFAASLDFANPVEVPMEFTDAQLSVPHPAGGVLYMKLRDDPSVTQTVTLPILSTETKGTTQTPAVLLLIPEPAASGAPQPPAQQPAQPQTSPSSESTTAVPSAAMPEGASAAASETKPAAAPTTTSDTKPANDAKPPAENPPAGQPPLPPK